MSEQPGIVVSTGQRFLRLITVASVYSLIVLKASRSGGLLGRFVINVVCQYLGPPLSRLLTVHADQHLNYLSPVTCPDLSALVVSQMN